MDSKPVSDNPVESGALLNACDVRDTTFDTPLPVFYPVESPVTQSVAASGGREAAARATLESLGYNVEQLAREAGDDWDHTLPDDKAFMARFAALVRAQALEAAAAICDGYARDYKGWAGGDDVAEGLAAG